MSGPRVLLVLLTLAVVTAVHELGHWAAVRARRGRVTRLQVGRGPAVWEGRRRDARIVVSILPFGGRIDYDGIHAPTAIAVVAVSGAAANLLLAYGLFLLAAAVGQAGSEPALARAAARVGAWFWLVPTALFRVVLEADASALRAAGHTLQALVVGRRADGVLALAGALSAVWAGVNLIPLPIVRTDGWHVVTAVWRAAFPRDPPPRGP